MRIGVVAPTAATRRGCRRRAIRATATWPGSSGATTTTLAIQQLNRLQNQQDLLSADARTGRVARVFRDESEDLGRRRRHRPLGRQGRAFLWLSERDGWRHILPRPRDGGDDAG